MVAITDAKGFLVPPLRGFHFLLAFPALTGWAK